MVVIGWIVRIVAVLFLLRMVLRLFSGFGRQTAASRRPSTPTTREGGHLVRDPHCGTYVPVARALKSGSGGTTMYFCSEACRTAWTARKAG